MTNENGTNGAELKEDNFLDTALAADDTDYGDGISEGLEENNSATFAGEGEQGQQQQQVDQQPSGNERGSGQGEGNAVRNATPHVGGKQNGQAETTPPGLRRVGNAFADAKGNIVDAKGNVIAPQGAAARLWSEKNRLSSQVETLNTQNNALKQQQQQAQALLQEAHRIAELPRQLGITAQEYNEGVALLAKFKQQPLDVAKEVVARVLALGYNASDILGSNAGDAIEMRGVQQMIREATAPMREQHQRNQQMQEQRANAERQYNEFIGKYPDAMHHQDAIANLMTQNKISPTEAYYAVRQFAIENQLDFNQPLGPQIEARNAEFQQRQQNGQRQLTSPRPMPNGGRGNGDIITAEPQLANASDDWSTIVNSVLRETN